jgi:hypothetical protein
MNPKVKRNLGEQMIVKVMRAYNPKAHDIVAASSVEMTHKMVARVCKRRRLTLNTQSKVLAALKTSDTVRRNRCAICSIPEF